MLQIRNVLDKTPAQELFKVFNKTYQALQREGYLKAFNYLGGLLIALDGSQHFSSEKIHCEKCSSRSHKNVGQPHTFLNKTVNNF
jgi:hypothetical protein